MIKDVIRIEKKIVMKNGDFKFATVEEVIFNDCEKAINAFAKKCVSGLSWTKNDFDYEDYVQSARMEIITMFDIYDEEHVFSSMVNTRLDQLYVHLLRYYGNKKRSMNNVNDEGSISYNEVRLSDKYSENYDYEDIIGVQDNEIGRSNILLAIEECSKMLNDKEKAILAFLIKESETKFEFAKKIGMSRPTLDTKIKYIRNLLKDLIAA